MNQIQLIKRAFEITWRYRVLWIFGILLALTSSSGSNQINWTFSSLNQNNRFPERAFGPPFGRFDPGPLLGILLLCCCLLLIVIVVSIIVNYVARAALYRMVDQREETGIMPTWREGFRLGWDDRTLRLFLLHLIVGILFAVAMFVLMLLAASPLVLLAVDSTFTRVLGIALAVALFLLVIVLLIVAGVIISVLGEFWSREIVLRDLSIGRAFSAGYAAVRARLPDVGVMWLLMFAIGIGFGILFLVIVIPVLMLAIGIGAGLGFALYSITESVLLAVLAGLPPFLLIMIVPLTFIGGLYEVFKSSVWTLTYRDVLREPETPAPVLTSGPAMADEV